MRKAVILSCEGLVLTREEQALFRECEPFGFILFKRNIDTPEQLRALTASLRESVGWDCPVLIDQEGGRVRRMRPPHWPDYPSMKEIGDLDDKDRLIETIRGIARDLNDAGIDVDCAPVLDVLFPETHQAIGDRAFSADPVMVSVLGSLACQVFLDEGITPVIKHLPGQGRAALDSHHDLPVVSATLDELRASDYIPCQAVAKAPYAGQVWGMVSHIVYTAIDPDHPASVSAKVIQAIRADIGFDGLLLSDDVSMNALEKYGKPEDRCLRMLEAGCDIALYCAGKLEELKDIAKIAPPLRPESIERYDRSRVSGRSAA